MMINKIVAFITTASVILSGNVLCISADEAAAVPVDIDQKVYTRLLAQTPEIDVNKDGIIDEEEFAGAEHLSINLNGVSDISWIVKAKSAYSIDFSYGEITDFSCLTQLKKLKDIDFYKVPISDISYLRSMDLDYLSLHDTNVSDSDQLDFFEFYDYQIPVGSFEKFKVSPIMNDLRYVIKDPGIGSLSETYKVSGCNLFGVSQGETVYEVYSGNEKIGEGKITVTEPEVFDPELSDTGEVSYAYGFTHDKYLNYRKKNELQIVSKNNNWYTINNYGISKTDQNVKDVTYIENLDVLEYCSEMVLYDNGELKLDGKNVFDSDVRISGINSNYVWSGSDLYYISIWHDSLSVDVLSHEFQGFVSNNLYKLTDGSLIMAVPEYTEGSPMYVSQYNAGIIDVKDVKETYSSVFVLDTEGKLYNLNTGIQEEKVLDISVIDNEVKCLGTLNDIEMDDIYEKKDGEVYFCAPPNKYKVTSRVNSRTYYNGRLLCNTSCYKGTAYKFDDGITVNGKTVLKNEPLDCFAAITTDNTVHMTFKGKYFAMTNVRDVYAGLYDGDNVYAYILRTDDTLWRYNINTSEIIRIDLDNDSGQILKGDIDLSGSVTAGDLLSLKCFILSSVTLTDDQMIAADINNDSKVNILDIIELIRYFLSE